eukprot:1671735-Prymnesium_polylepis.1
MESLLVSIISIIIRIVNQIRNRTSSSCPSNGDNSSSSVDCQRLWAHLNSVLSIAMTCVDSIIVTFRSLKDLQVSSDVVSRRTPLGEPRRARGRGAPLIELLELLGAQR